MRTEGTTTSFSDADLQLTRTSNDVLFLLSNCRKLNWGLLSQTRIQTMLFLCSALAPVANLEWGYSFTLARYGPYNASIQTATERLLIRRLVEVQINLSGSNDILRSKYQITDVGQRTSSIVERIEREHRRAELIRSIMEILDLYGPTVALKIADREPTLKTMRTNNERGLIPIDTVDNASVLLTNKIRAVLANEYSIELDTLNSQFIAYFDFLSASIGAKHPE